MTFSCRGVASFSTALVLSHRQTCNDIALFPARTQNESYSSCLRTKFHSLPIQDAAVYNALYNTRLKSGGFVNFSPLHKADKGLGINEVTCPKWLFI